MIMKEIQLVESIIQLYKNDETRNKYKRKDKEKAQKLDISMINKIWNRII